MSLRELPQVASEDDEVMRRHVCAHDEVDAIACINDNVHENSRLTLCYRAGHPDVLQAKKSLDE
jgi:hypothetical protein